ncbi:hypothetical protein SBA3_2610021 [Candidatus Sulfopaludibacter sp. SbA3]|nr:hypothetical protein SBA3_2610021 [Candidatus Sulfopaludibacter sp. SbA3]
MRRGSRRHELWLHARGWHRLRRNWSRWRFDRGRRRRRQRSGLDLRHNRDRVQWRQRRRLAVECVDAWSHTARHWVHVCVSPHDWSRRGLHLARCRRSRRTHNRWNGLRNWCSGRFRVNRGNSSRSCQPRLLYQPHDSGAADCSRQHQKQDMLCFHPYLLLVGVTARRTIPFLPPKPAKINKHSGHAAVSISFFDRPRPHRSGHRARANGGSLRPPCSRQWRV